MLQHRVCSSFFVQAGVTDSCIGMSRRRRVPEAEGETVSVENEATPVGSAKKENVDDVGQEASERAETEKI